MITAEQILDEAGQILADPEHWMQDDLCNYREATDEDKNLMMSTSYCSIGAIHEATRRLYGSSLKVTPSMGGAFKSFTHALREAGGDQPINRFME